MKKIVFCNIMMRDDIKPAHYKVTGNSSIAFDGEVAFPINGVLAKTLNRDDDVKVVLVIKEDINKNSSKNVENYKNELDAINKSIGAKIRYEEITAPHNEDREVQEDLLKDMVGELIDDAHIYADITYGTKSLPIIMFSALNFAERFFRAEIKYIAYGKVDFIVPNKASNHELFDMTALFYLNSIISTIECSSGDMAKKMLDTLLAE